MNAWQWTLFVAAIVVNLAVALHGVTLQQRQLRRAYQRGFSVGWMDCYLRRKEPHE